MTRSPLQLALSARKPPLWARWLLTILGFAVLGVAAVIAVHSINDSALPAERSAVLEADRESQAAIEADQAPHSSPLSSFTRTRTALQGAIATDMHNRIRHGQLPGPLQGVRCTPAGARRPQGQAAFHCTARAAAITYPFLGVVDKPARQLTWCKVDPSPVHDGPQEIPVSPRCRA